MPPTAQTSCDDALLYEAIRTWMQRRDALVHTLPNLTLLTPPANSQIGNADFAAEKARLAESPLKTHVAIAAEVIWDEDAIGRRADVLTSLAKRVWPYPHVSW